jgi:hypothetical protein
VTVIPRLSWNRATILCVAAVVCGAIVGLAPLTRLYEVDANGVSLFVGKPPTLDFTNLWFGGRLAIAGQTDTLFDIEAYRGALERMFNSSLQPSEWSYPPSLLLVGVPLALMPLYPAYVLWTIGTLGALSLILYRAGLPLAACLLLWISPAALTNIFFGHNGAATAALLIGGLLTAERKPWVAGLCFGLLTMKPHLGILVPVCLVAAGYWRAIGWSAFFSVVIGLMTAAWFGPEVWQGFFTVTQPFMQGVLEAPYGNNYQLNAATLFLTARWLGADLTTAYVFQSLASIGIAMIVWKIWREDSDLLVKVAATAALTPLATPYAYSYDMVMVAAAVIILAFRIKPSFLFLPAWLLPAFIAPLNRDVGHVAPLLLALAAALFGLIAVQASRTARAQPARTAASHPG